MGPVGVSTAAPAAATRWFRIDEWTVRTWARRACALSLVLVASCHQRTAPAAAPGVLRLELGGDNEPLAQQLRQAGVALREPPPSSPDPGGPSLDSGNATPGGDDAPVAAAKDVGAGSVETAPPVAPPARSVLLADHETLSVLAQRHLGSSSRWPEIARLNGWSDAQVKRLRVGTVVRLP